MVLIEVRDDHNVDVRNVPGAQKIHQIFARFIFAGINHHNAMFRQQNGSVRLAHIQKHHFQPFAFFPRAPRRAKERQKYAEHCQAFPKHSVPPALTPPNGGGLALYKCKRVHIVGSFPILNAIIQHAKRARAKIALIDGKRRERRIGKLGKRNVVKSHDGDVFRDTQARARESRIRANGRKIVHANDGREGLAALHEPARQGVAIVHGRAEIRRTLHQ